MKKVKITRRQLLAAGLAAGVAAAIPISGLWISIPDEDTASIGANALDDVPYQAENTGELDTHSFTQLEQYCRWSMQSWEFEHIDSYLSALPDLIAIKCSQTPSYLAEYKNAADVIERTFARLQSPEKSFFYLMFTAREEKLSRQTRLGRASYFVFDELLRHMLATGGFKRFGLTNYNGNIHLPFYDAKAYRRETTL